MAIFLAGATGFIGGHILRTLSAQGYEVTCLVRPASRRPTTACQPLEALPGVRVVEGEWTCPESWLNSVAGNEMVINAVGIIRESRLASLALWPDPPHLETARPERPGVNAVERFLGGLRHDNNHIDQIRNIVAQARVRRVA